MFKNKIYDRECIKYCIRSHDQKMYLQEITEKSLSPFDDKQDYIDETKSKPCGGF